MMTGKRSLPECRNKARGVRRLGPRDYRLTSSRPVRKHRENCPGKGPGRMLWWYSLRSHATSSEFHGSVSLIFTTRPELRGTFGAVASTHWLASAAGMAVLERGGNAFDAACAAGFVLQVVEPHLNGPGGDLPVVFWSVDAGEPLVLCAQGVAPAAATIERFRALGHDHVPGTGVLAACVPGSFGGWLLL